jgi:two-component system, cell cycle sensor histidine kinase and response regulator CckA
VGVRGDEAGRPRTAATRASNESSVGYYDREGRFLYATPEMASYVGMTPDELIGRTWYEIGVPPEAVDGLEAARRRVLETGNSDRQKATFQVGGSDRETEFSIRPVRGRDGSIVGTVVTAWDPSEHRESSRGKARLDRTYAILSAIDQVILHAHDSDVILSEACRIAAGLGGFELAWIALLDAASGDVRMAFQSGRDEGLLADLVLSSRDEPSGRGVVGTSIRENRSVVVQDVRHDPRMAPWRTFFDRLGYRTAAGFPIRVRGGTIGSLVLYSARVGHFDAAEARLYEQMAEDISAAVDTIETRKAMAETESALVEAEQRTRDLFGMNPQAMWVFDIGTLRFLAVNNAAINAYGYSRDEFLAMTLKDIRMPEDVPALVADIAIPLPDQGGYRPPRQWRHVRKDGSPIYVEVTAHDIMFDGRKARLVMAIDVTERRRLEAKLAEATRLEAMGALAGGIAHDFNNLLTAVNGYADILIEELEGDERVESAREIRRAGARAAELTRQVLAFARRQVLVPRAVDVNVVVASVGQMLRRLIGEQISLVTKLDDSSAVVLADPGQLEQVLVNLAVNSRDAMPDGGVLEIEVRRVEDAGVLDHDLTGRAVLVTVADTGIGMDEATMARAFEPFFTTKDAAQGTGLGLATVYGIVHQSNGRTWVESGVGRGTTVSVLLPLVETPPEPRKVAAPSALQGRDEAAILVVEDDSAVRAFVVSTLERAGYSVLAAASPAHATALSDGLAEAIDLLLTDLIMPGGNGRDLAARLLTSRPSLRVVLMSGYDATISEVAPGRRVLAKPFDAEELLAAVREALSAP